MPKAETYRAELAASPDWDTYLISHSGLPGPRANLELLDVAAELASENQIKHWLAFDVKRAPPGTREEYLAVCGAVGLGKLIALGKRKYLVPLRARASDARWRVREGVAIALQHWGDSDFDAVLNAVEPWREGNLFEQRAIAAALCEPRLLKKRAQVKRVLKLLDGITGDFAKTQDRKSDAFVVLKKGLSYCWSVAAAASPDDGKRAMEKWFASSDPAVRAVMRENLNKERLKRMDAGWVRTWQTRLG